MIIVTSTPTEASVAARGVPGRIAARTKGAMSTTSAVAGMSSTAGIVMPLRRSAVTAAVLRSCAACERRVKSAVTRETVTRPCGSMKRR